MDFVAREHENVREHLGHMAAIAEAGPGDITMTLRNSLDAVFRFLHADLLTLMAFEEETLYPALDRIPGVPHTPGAMAADHDTIRRAIDVLDDLAGAGGWERWSASLHRPLVVRVQARIRTHLNTEEFLYGPLLSRLDPHEYARLYQLLPKIRPARRRAGGLQSAAEAPAPAAGDTFRQSEPDDQ
jgi:Hemerythrin HHE cation binding domain